MSTGPHRGNMKERIMKFIDTTTTALDKLKRKAWTYRKTESVSLAFALDEVARQGGYDHWRHVTQCHARTALEGGGEPLPAELQSFLDRAAQTTPASVASQLAFERGLVFAMDVKEANELSFPADYVECDDAWYLVARDLWRGLARERDEVTGLPYSRSMSSDEFVEFAFSELDDYRYFRYSGGSVPSTLESAYEQIARFAFFSPRHFWLAGKHIDLGAALPADS